MHALALVLLLSGPIPAAAGPPPATSALVGAWHVTHNEQGGQKDPMPPGMTLVLWFEATGAVHQIVLRGTAKKKTSGTYAVKGAEVHITLDGQLDRLRWVIAGDRLTLSKIGTSEVVYLVRGPVPR